MIFSTSGYVGRAVWWWTQLITVPIFAVLVLGLIYTTGRISHLSSVQEVKNDAYLQSLSLPERNNEKREMISEDWNIVLALALALLLSFWVHLVIEIKRWHDLDLSGFCVLIRIVPPLAHAQLGVVAGTVISIVLPLGVIYFLGFRSGIYDPSQRHHQPSRSALAILNDVAGPVGLILLIAAAFKFGFISFPSDTTFNVVPPSLFQSKSEPVSDDSSR